MLSSVDIVKLNAWSMVKWPSLDDIKNTLGEQTFFLPRDLELRSDEGNTRSQKYLRAA